MDALERVLDSSDFRSVSDLRKALRTLSSWGLHRAVVCLLSRALQRGVHNPEYTYSCLRCEVLSYRVPVTPGIELLRRVHRQYGGSTSDGDVVRAALQDALASPHSVMDVTEDDMRGTTS